jgi:plasmid stabilization system protein ParE
MALGARHRAQAERDLDGIAEYISQTSEQAAYIVFYRPTRREVELVRVLHSSRDIDEELAKG